jgi:hypothetical protein
MKRNLKIGCLVILSIGALALVFSPMLQLPVNAIDSPAPVTVKNLFAPLAPLSGVITQTTYADFAAPCAVLTDTHISYGTSGSIVLSGQLNDDFNGTSLNSGLWSNGTYTTTTNSPVISGSVLTVPSANWVRSQITYTHGIVDAVAEFGNAEFQHLGFASNNFDGNRYLIFSTFTGDGHLYARVNNNAEEQATDLGLIPTGMHRYRVEWAPLDATNDQATFFIDGVQVAQLPVTNVDANGFYVYFSNNGTGDLKIDKVDASPPFVSNGTYTSCAFDAGSQVGSKNVWQAISWLGTKPISGTVTVEVRTSPNGTNWGSWVTIPGGIGTISPQDQFMQYRFHLSTTDSGFSPVIDSVSLTNQTVAYTPTPTSTDTSTPTPTDTSTPTPTDTATPTPTDTATPTPTDTATPTPTNTVTPTPTNTSIPPSPTNTSTPPTPTNTPVPTVPPNSNFVIFLPEIASSTN